MGRCLFMRKGEIHSAPISGINASDLAVGSTVKLMENGSPVEYLVVHNGLPSSMYDSSCDGVWLLRKDIHSKRQWGMGTNNDYEKSSIHTWLNDTFINEFAAEVKACIKQVKIPYQKGTGSGGSVYSGQSGLSTKVFLLSGYEVGWTTGHSSNFPVDGACLSYFSGTASTDTKRIAYSNGAAVPWVLRSASKGNTSNVWQVYTNGSSSASTHTAEFGIRPVLILPSNAVFDKNTLILKGVS